MPSPFSRLINVAVDAHFKKDRNGRRVFLPLISRRGKAYFVDSDADEAKIRAFVKMYRAAILLISLLFNLGIYLDGGIFNIYASASPLRNKLEAIGWSFSILVLFLGGSAWLLWSAYKEGIATFTDSLTEVGPVAPGRLQPFADAPRRWSLAAFVGGLIVLGLAILWAVSFHK
jgi:hypothetical protein